MPLDHSLHTVVWLALVLTGVAFVMTASGWWIVALGGVTFGVGLGSLLGFRLIDGD